MSRVPDVEKLIAMSWGDRRKYVDGLDAEEADACLNKFEAMRKQGLVNKPVSLLKENILSRLRYLDRLKGPVTLDTLVRLSRNDARNTIYHLDADTATGLQLEAELRLEEMTSSENSYYPLKHVATLLSRRLFYLASEAKPTEALEVGDLIYVKKEVLVRRVLEMKSDQLHAMITDLSTKMHHRPVQEHEKRPETDGRHRRVLAELSKAYSQCHQDKDTGSLTLTALERMEPVLMRRWVKTLPGEMAVKLYGDSLLRAEMGALYGSERQLHNALTSRVEKGIELEAVMGAERALQYIHYYGKEDMAELVDQLQACVATGSLGLGGHEEEVASAIRARWKDLNTAENLEASEGIFAPFRGKTAAQIAGILSEMEITDREPIVELACRMMATDSRPVGFQWDIVEAIVNWDAQTSEMPEIVAQLLVAPIEEVAAFLGKEPAENVVALQEKVRSLEGAEISPINHQKLEQISAIIDECVPVVFEQGATRAM